MSVSGEKHTPGPWRMSRVERPPIGRQPNGNPWPTDANGNVFYGYSVTGSSENGASILPTLAAVHNFPDHVEANARLIAAAPDLADTGAELLSLLDGWMVVTSITATERYAAALEAFRAAIARATGETA